MRSQEKCLLCIILLLLLSSSNCWNIQLRQLNLNFHLKLSNIKLRQAFGSLAAVVAIYHVPGETIKPAVAFDNAIPNIYTMPKSNGPKPTNLGVDKRGLLRACLKPSPNCFSTTPDSLTTSSDEDEDDKDLGVNDIHLIPRWKYDKGDADEAYRLIGKVLESYEPGQSNIDGGGFKIFERNDKTHYYYVQYESLKRGYIDDLEIAVSIDGSIQLVSSSRLGYLDFQVNAKRWVKRPFFDFNVSFHHLT